MIVRGCRHAPGPKGSLNCCASLAGIIIHLYMCDIVSLTAGPYVPLLASYAVSVLPFVMHLFTFAEDLELISNPNSLNAITLPKCITTTTRNLVQQ